MRAQTPCRLAVVSRNRLDEEALLGAAAAQTARCCHINRPIGRLVADAGLELTRLDNYYLKGPRAFGYMFDGVAGKPGGQ